MNYKLTEEDLKAHLDEQIHLLKTTCTSYDLGDISQAKLIATQLRGLLHTARSDSLLKQLKMLDQDFLNTARPQNQEDYKVAEALLVATHLGMGAYVPVYDSAQTNEYISFVDWWDMPILISTNGEFILTRKELVRIMANQDGVSHVDPSLQEKYAHFSRNNGFNTMIVTGFEMLPDGGFPPTLENANFESIPQVEYASVRQIAHELLATLDEQITIADQPSGVVVGNIYLKKA